MRITWGQIAGLLVIVGVAGWAIRYAGRDLRLQLGKKSGAERSTLTPDEVKAIVSHGLATHEQLFAMKPAEQRMLAASALAMSGAQTQRRTREQ